MHVFYVRNSVSLGPAPPPNSLCTLNPVFLYLFLLSVYSFLWPRCNPIRLLLPWQLNVFSNTCSIQSLLLMFFRNS